MMAVTLEETFEEIFRKYISNEFSHKNCQRCSDPPEVTYKNEINIKEIITPWLKYIDRDILYFIYRSDTCIDNIKDPAEAISLMQKIRDESSTKFPGHVSKKLEKIYQSEYKLINKESLTNNEKLYFRSKSWLWSAVACITPEGIEFCQREHDNWREIIVKTALLMMILDDIIDLDEDKDNDQPNSILLSENRVLELIGFEWLDVMTDKISDKIAFKGCYYQLIESQEMKKQIRLLFHSLKEYAIARHMP